MGDAANKFSPEVREPAVWLDFENEGQHGSANAGRRSGLGAVPTAALWLSVPWGRDDGGIWRWLPGGDSVRGNRTQMGMAPA